MRIFFTISTVLFSLIFTQFAYAGCAQGRQSACNEYGNGVKKKLRKHNRLVCIKLRQSERGNVLIHLRGTAYSAQNDKRQKDTICVPSAYILKTHTIVLCGCKTATNPAGRWQRISVTGTMKRQVRDSRKRKTYLHGYVPLCRNK